MAAESDVHPTARINRSDDAGHERRRVMARTDEQTGFPHRVCYLVLMLVVTRCMLSAGDHKTSQDTDGRL